MKIESLRNLFFEQIQDKVFAVAGIARIAVNVLKPRRYPSEATSSLISPGKDPGEVRTPCTGTGCSYDRRMT
jgi:hypothetical protein